MPNFTPYFMLKGGIRPKDFGRSALCKKISRKNRLRRLGIGGDKR